MNKEQTLKHFTKETPLKVSEGLFNELQLEGSNSFYIERICRGMETVDLYHLDSGEVVEDVSIEQLISREKELKTVEQWLNTLPEPYRTQALNNADTKCLFAEECNPQDAILKAFTWDYSTEGFHYWNDFYNSFNS